MIKRFALLVSIITLLQACTALGPKPSEQILGTWKTEVGKFPMTVTYEASTVQSGNNAPIAYALSGSELTYAEGGKQVRVLSFPSANEMIQVDPITGTEHRFTRQL